MAHPRFRPKGRSITDIINRPKPPIRSIAGIVPRGAFSVVLDALCVAFPFTEISIRCGNDVSFATDPPMMDREIWKVIAKIETKEAKMGD